MVEKLEKSDLEIIVSTRNRSNLDFLVPMFPFGSYLDFTILIINQTTADNLLTTELPNIRAINSLDKGLSKSRNLALKYAQKKIILIADDDVCYLRDFDQKIIKSYNENPLASVICFQTLTKESKFYSNYKSKKHWMAKADFIWVLSIEITFKINDLKNKKVLFNENFGLGAQFQDAESLFFLRRANYNNLKVLFCPVPIVIHERFSSSDDISSDRWLYAKTASFYKMFSLFAYILLFKVIFFLLRKGFISLKGTKHKIKIGLKGIKDYKLLLKNKSEYKYD